MDYTRFPHHRRGDHSGQGERQARLLDTLGTPSLHRLNPDGSVSRKVNDRLYVEPAEPKQTATQLSRLAWVPEGMVITPRTASAPNGWGLPPTSDGAGTPGGDFPFVVINHYRHNNTPEYLHTVYSDAPRITGLDVRMALNWPALYLDKADVGAWRGGRYLGQFVGRWVPLLKEKRQTGWFAHRPEVRAWPFSMMPSILTGVNARRAEVSRHPVSPPLAGWTADLAQAVCLENVRAKVVDHESTDFRPGWQSPSQRAWDRAGQLESVGENLYASYGAAKGSDLGNETVAAWRVSAPHDATMRYDYTEGLRTTRETNGTAQLTGEVMSLGTWPKTNVGLTSTAKEVTAVFMSASPRGPRCTTWRHPQYGSMSINTGPGSFAHAATRNLVWALDGYVSYKHTDIQAVKNVAENFTTQRELLLGAALCAVSTGGEVDAGTWAFMLAEKQRREASYNRRRVDDGLPEDNSCVGSESDLNRSQTGYELRLRTLSYEESGTPYDSPNTGTTCRLVLREGKAEDFLATRTIVKSFTIPFNPSSIALTARFSEDGHKVTATCAEYLTDGSWVGEKLHFYEFTDDSVLEVGTAEMTIASSVSGSTYTQSAYGRCHLYPYYDGNTLLFMDLGVNHAGSFTDSDPAEHTRSLVAWLVLPVEFNWVFCNTETSPSGGVNGYVRHLLYLDPLEPERTHWVEYNLVASGADTICSARVMRNAYLPELVKTLYTSVTPTTSDPGQPWLVPLFANKSSTTVSSWVQDVHPTYPWGTPPAADFKASFALGTVGMVRTAGAPYRFGTATPMTPYSTPLAPVWFADVSGYPDTMSDASVSDAYVFAGQLAWQPFGFGLSGAPGGSWVYFKSSSIDLEAVTGISGMSDEILPIWSL